MAIETHSSCSLCGLPVVSRPFVEGPHTFCCAGCHAVHTVLNARAELEKGLDHPLVEQAAVAGLISNPLLLDELHKKQQKAISQDIEREKIYFLVEGLWCSSCPSLIQYILLQQKGIIHCVVDYATDMACVEYQPRYIDKQAIYDKVQSLGYSVDNLEDPRQKKVSRAQSIRCVITAFFAINVMMLAYPLYATFYDPSADDIAFVLAWLSCLASIPVITYGAWPIYKRFWGAVKTGYFGMETLVTLGSLSAIGLSVYKLLNGDVHVYFDTAVVIIALVLAGKMTEATAKFNAKQTLFRLAKMQPRRGRKVLEDGTFAYVPLSEIQVGDCIKTLAGERLILDGVVVEGQGTCDESLLTGESLPVAKEEGSKLIGGSVLLHGSLVWKATAAYEESLQQRIFQMVQRDIGQKQVQEGRLDKILRYFIPFMLVAAAAAFIVWYQLTANLDTAFEIALSVLIIACPCALGIAIPLVESQLIQRLAETGVLVRNRLSLQYLGDEDCIVFDKTGTITEGYFKVLEGQEALTLEQRDAIGAIARQSTHPVAQALAREFESNVVPESSVEYAGKGMEGIVHGRRYIFGSTSFLASCGIDECQKFAPTAGSTPCFIAENNTVIAVLLLGDRIREDALSTLRGLEGVKTLLLSGDSTKAVEAIAKKCGFKYWLSEQSPLQKREEILHLKQKQQKVAMVGDGINDAPALTAADIAISVVSAADISIQVSDLLLTTEKLSPLLEARRLAGNARRLVKQNLFWTFAYNVAGIGLAFLGWLTPIYSAFAMVASSLIVVLNARRL